MTKKTNYFKFSQIGFSFVLAVSLPVFATQDLEVEGKACLSGQCSELAKDSSLKSSIALAEQVQQTHLDLNSVQYLQNLFEINIEIDLGTVNKGAALLNGSLGFLGKFETFRNLAKDYQVDLTKDKIETPYKSAKIRTQLKAVLNSQGDLIGFQVGERNHFTMTLEKTTTSQPYIENLANVVLPLDLVNGREEVSVSAEIAGLSRTLLTIKDTKLNSREGGTLKLGFIQSAAFGGTHTINLKINRDSFGRFQAQQIQSHDGSSFGDDGLNFQSFSSGLSSTARIEGIRIQGGVVSTRMDILETESVANKEEFVQGEERAQIESNTSEMKKLLNTYKNKSTELVDGAGARIKVSVK